MRYLNDAEPMRTTANAARSQRAHVTEPAAAQPDPAQHDLDWLRRSTAAVITRTDTARVLNVDERTVTRAIESGELPSLQVGRRVLVPRLPLLRLLGADDSATAALTARAAQEATGS